jgi:serine/threonine protein kinase
MLDYAGVLRVIDFGLSGICSLRRSRVTGNLKHVPLLGQKGTPGCMAPEVLVGRYEGQEADMWGIGVLLYEILTGMNPFQKSKSTDDIRRSRILSGLYNTDSPAYSKLSLEAKELLAELFAVRPEQRASIQRVRESDWMRMTIPKPDSLRYCSAWATMPQRFNVIEDKKEVHFRVPEQRMRMIDEIQEERDNASSKEGKAQFPTLHRNHKHGARHTKEMMFRLGSQKLSRDMMIQLGAIGPTASRGPLFKEPTLGAERTK